MNIFLQAVSGKRGLSSGSPGRHRSRSPLPPAWPEVFRENINGLDRGVCYLVAVSGGVDSRVLLHLLLQSGFQNLVVSHLDHRLRGSESAADARLVRRLAARLTLPLYLRSVNEWPANLSLETAARQARHRFFANGARQYGAAGVFLGHQANDQVETFLFNLFRGTASLGHAAMQFRSTIDIEGQKVLFLRPLLSVWKTEIYAFAKANCLRYREDKSNQESVFSRNKLRNDLIPQIEALFGRPIAPAILRTCFAALDDEDFLQSLVPAMWQEAQLSVPLVRRLPVPAQRRLIYRWLRYQGIPDVNFDHVQAVRSLLWRTTPAKSNLPAAKHCRRGAGKLFIE